MCDTFCQDVCNVQFYSIQVIVLYYKIGILLLVIGIRIKKKS